MGWHWMGPREPRCYDLEIVLQDARYLYYGGHGPDGHKKQWFQGQMEGCEPALPQWLSQEGALCSEASLHLS